MTATASIAVIGGSGLYELFDDPESHVVTTPYGPADVTLGDLGGRRVAFLTRHGRGHAHAPHLIGYRANIWALASLGVRAIVSTAAVGSINRAMPPESIVLPDQFIDRTAGRADTFFDTGSVQHLVAADPFCPDLRAIAQDALAATGEQVIPAGTVVVVQGPRFSTRAESRWFSAAGGDLVNMTLVPEVPLAAELGIGTVNLSFVTDTDAGDADSGEEPVTAEHVFARLAAAQPRLVAALTAIVAAIPADYAPRELIDPAAVAEVLARPVVERPASA
jgi:5'-methylthioadenosine phosphorylase